MSRRQVERRTFLSSVLVCLVWSRARAQQAVKTPFIGMLRTSGGTRDRVADAFLRGMRDLGYTENVNFKLTIKNAEGDPWRLPGLATELVREGVDVIVVGTEPATRAAKQATSSIPIVMYAYTFDPVAVGFIGNVGHPTGNLTGVTARAHELGAKRLELLKEAIPSLTRVAVLYDALARNQVEDLKRAGASLRIQLELDELRPPFDFQSAIQAAHKRRVGALMVLTSSASYGERARIAQQALQNRLPVTSYAHEVTREGGFMSYGLELEDAVYRTAYFIDKLLKGAKPSDLPVEESENLKLVVNLKTAKALGITIPESILLRADEVIR